MCVCSPDSCRTANVLSTVVNQQAICASNNVTFESECAMAAWKCIHQQSALYKKYDGQCQSKANSSFFLLAKKMTDLFVRRGLSKCSMSARHRLSLGRKHWRTVLLSEETLQSRSGSRTGLWHGRRHLFEYLCDAFEFGCLRTNTGNRSSRRLW